MKHKTRAKCGSVLCFVIYILCFSSCGDELAEAGLVVAHGERFVGFDDQEKIGAGRGFVLQEAEGLAESAFEEIACDGVSAARADGDAEACRAVVVAAE